MRINIYVYTYWGIYLKPSPWLLQVMLHDPDTHPRAVNGFSLAPGFNYLAPITLKQVPLFRHNWMIGIHPQVCVCVI